MTSIRWKLILMALLIVFIPIYILNRSSLDFFDYHARTAVEQEMRNNAKAIGEIYTHEFRSTSALIDSEKKRKLEETLRVYSEIFESRFQVISSEKEILFDFGKDDYQDELQAEVKDLEMALANHDFGAHFKLTADRQLMYYFISYPILDEGRVVAVVRVTRHTNNIIMAIDQMKRMQQIAISIALGVALLASVLLAWTITRPLRRLQKMTQSYVRGTGEFTMSEMGRDEIGDLGRSINSLAQEIESSNDYNRDFMTTITHELRTPLTIIKSSAELLRDGQTMNSRQHSKFTGNILFETERMIRQVNELSELTRLDSEIQREQREDLNYVEFVETAIDRIKSGLDAGHPEIICELPNKELMVHAVPGRLEQVLANLIENACRFTPEEGTVKVQVLEVGELVTTSVHDSGPGVEEKYYDKIFDRFFTTKSPDSPGDDGRGLGLSIARSIIESHGGKIELEVGDFSGARFVFQLPVIWK